MRKAALDQEKTVAELLKEAYAEEEEEEGPIEVQIDYDEGERILRGESKEEKKSNSKKVLGKVKAKKHKEFKLKPFYIPKGKERKFNNEKPSKESIELQDKSMVEVV